MRTRDFVLSVLLLGSLRAQADNKTFLESLGLNSIQIGSLFGLSDDQQNYIQVYDRPNDDPDQNEAVIKKLGIKDQRYAYSTSKLILLLRATAKSPSRVELSFQWAAEMMVGQNTEGGRGCYIQHKENKHRFEILYPEGVSIRSMTHQKKGSLIHSPRFELETVDLDRDSTISGKMLIKRNEHVHYVIFYVVQVKNKRIESVSMRATNNNAIFEEYDLFLIGEKSPDSTRVHESRYFQRPNDVAAGAELVGAGDEKISELITRAGCLKCHGGDEAEHGQEFSSATSLPLYPDKLHSAFSSIASLSSSELRDSAIEGMKNKWPKHMRESVSKLFHLDSDAALVMRWLEEAIRQESLKKR